MKNLNPRSRFFVKIKQDMKDLIKIPFLFCLNFSAIKKIIRSLLILSSLNKIYDFQTRKLRSFNLLIIEILALIWSFVD